MFQNIHLVDSNSRALLMSIKDSAPAPSTSGLMDGRRELIIEFCDNNLVDESIYNL